MATANRNSKFRNRILAGLPVADRKRIAKRLELVPLELKQVLFDVDTPIKYVYFLERGVASIVSVMSDGVAVEAATIGNEGLVGLPLFHGVDRIAAQAFIQIPGDAYRMTSSDFREELKRRESALPVRLGRYTEALFALVAQSAGCNRVHPIRQRCARWLLLTHDRVDSDEFALSQRFLSQMLGVRRAGVTKAAGELHRARLIRYRAGRVTVLNRQGLERASCECYAIISQEFARLIDGRPRKDPLSRVRTSSSGKSVLEAPRQRRSPRAPEAKQ